MTLETLVVTESREGTRQSTACLVRLIRYVSNVINLANSLIFINRGLLFTCQALVNMQEDRSCELRVCFKRSYDTTLKHHHGWLVQSAVSVGTVPPYRVQALLSHFMFIRWRSEPYRTGRTFTNEYRKEGRMMTWMLNWGNGLAR